MVNDKEFYYCERCEKETMYKMRITDKRVVYECEDCTQLVTDDEVIRYNRLKMLENIFLNMLESKGKLVLFHNKNKLHELMA